MTAICTKCGRTTNLGERVGAKLVGGLAGSVLGGGISKHPLGVLLGMVAGALLGHQLDRKVLPNCPTCGAALRIVDAATPWPV